MAALGAKKKWSDCNHAVAIMFEMSGDWMHDYQTMIPDQLAAGIRVLIYAGDQDYICNWLGNRAWVRGLKWPGQAAFNATTVDDWNVNGDKAGARRPRVQHSPRRRLSHKPSCFPFDILPTSSVHVSQARSSRLAVSPSSECTPRGTWCRAISRRLRCRCSTSSSAARSDADVLDMRSARLRPRCKRRHEGSGRR